MDKANYIKVLIILLFLLFAVPNQLDAAQVKITYEDYQKTIIYKPTCDPVKGVAEKDDCFYQEPKQTYLASNPSFYPTQCVWYAKTITGIYGTWGNGGRYLTDNSDPAVGVVIIFNYTHVGVITEFDGVNIGYTDRNSDRKGTIRSIVWTTINDPTIWKYHKF